MIDNGPGTLWETLSSETSSVCHGFAIHAGVRIIQDFLELRLPDEVNKILKITPNPSGFLWAKGSV